MTARLLAIGICGLAAALCLGACDETAPTDEPSATVEPATSLPQGLGDYCEVQGWRTLVEDGQVRIEDFPDWTDGTVVDGTPRIIDFTTEPDDGLSGAERLDRLDAETSWGDAEQPVPRSYQSACMSLTSDADIVRTQGALGYGAEVGRATPEAAPKHPVPSLGEDLGGYCQVQNLRELLAEGRLTLEDLPDSVDDTEVDGSPRIVDYTSAPDSVFGHYAQLDTIVDAVARVDERLASTLWTGDAEDALRRCAASTTEADVRRTQGHAGYAAAED